MFTNCPTHPLKNIYIYWGYLTKNWHAVSLTPHARFLRSKIDHILANNSKQKSKKALARESGAQWVLLDGKKPKVDNIVTLSLIGLFKTENKIFFWCIFTL
jgi:hypothetical protein